MSMDLVVAVRESQTLDNTYEKSLAFALASHANRSSGEAWPAVQTLAVESGMSERKARDVLSTLRKKGILEVVRKSAQHRPTRYCFNKAALKCAPHACLTTNAECLSEASPAQPAPLSGSDLHKEFPRPAGGDNQTCTLCTQKNNKSTRGKSNPNSGEIKKQIVDLLDVLCNAGWSESAVNRQRDLVRSWSESGLSPQGLKKCVDKAQSRLKRLPDTLHYLRPFVASEVEAEARKRSSEVQYLAKVMDIRRKEGECDAHWEARVERANIRRIERNG